MLMEADLLLRRPRLALRVGHRGDWACGRRREAARRWAAHRRWELGRNAEYYATKLSAVRKILDCVVEARTAGSSFESVAQQQKHLMDRLVLEQLSKD